MAQLDASARGPFVVGHRQIEVAAPDPENAPDRCLPTDVWYPAALTCEARDDAPHPLGMPHRATPALPPLDAGPLPLLAFSHGNSGMRQQSTFLTTHLASWGFVVAAPDHVGNTFTEMMALETDEERRAVHLDARRRRPQDITRVLAHLLDEASRDDEPHGGPALDARRIGVLGHSYGGWTALKTPRLEARVRAVCGLAPASEPFVGRRAFERDELPLASDVEALVIAATDDVLVDRATSIEPLVERLGPAARFELLTEADHFHFCDGIELLHTMHEKTPRPGLPRPPRPFGELRSEADSHAWLNRRVARFFLDVLGPPPDPTAAGAPA